MDCVSWSTSASLDRARRRWRARGNLGSRVDLTTVRSTVFPDAWKRETLGLENRSPDARKRWRLKSRFTPPTGAEYTATGQRDKQAGHRSRAEAADSWSATEKNSTTTRVDRPRGAKPPLRVNARRTSARVSPRARSAPPKRRARARVATVSDVKASRAAAKEFDVGAWR
jgi:hypothetical protein